MTAQKLNIPFEEYRELPGYNFSLLAKVEQSLRHYKHGGSRSTKSLSLGRRAHMAILEPGQYHGTILTDADWAGGVTKTGRPTTNKQSSAYKEWRDQIRAKGGEVVPEYEHAQCLGMARAVREHPLASKYLSGGEAEVTVSWEHPRLGGRCKSRLDYVGDCLVDLKTTSRPNPSAFRSSVRRYRYHAQAAMYQDAWTALTGDVLPFVIVSVETSRPYDVVCYTLDYEALNEGRRLYESWLVKAMHADATGQYPGMGEELQTITGEDVGADTVLTIGGMEVAI